MKKFNIKKGDTVYVNAGNDKGKTGVKQEAGIHISNVNLVDNAGKPTRIAHKEVDGKKVRIAKTTGEEIK